MYYEHFGLESPPFKITPDTHLFYSGGKRGLVLDALLYAIKTGEGIIKVVGEVGSGKTMLCRMLEARLPKQVEVVYLANPHVSPDMVLHAIAFEMRLTIKTEDNRLHVMHRLQAALLEKHAQGRQVVVFIEEAQAMPLETLEEIRLLTNLETNRDKLLQMVLFGQPELDANLAKPHVRQLKERITHNFYLEPLNKQEIENYLYFRMQSVGYRGLPVFDKAAIKMLYIISQGLIRRLNILADKALLIAFMENTHFVQKKYILRAAQDSNFSIPYQNKIPLKSVSLILLILLLTFLLSPHNTWINQQLQQLFSPPQNSLQPITTPPPIKPSPSQNTPATDSITLPSQLQQRLIDSNTRLKQLNPQSYTLQLFQINDDKPEELERFLRLPDVQRLQTELLVLDIGQSLIIIYGIYPDEIQADNALKNLAERLQRNKPFIRQINNLLKVKST
ncbi:type II secretory pathway, component ExeA (predicted ATPase) [Beggiatoa alba B18LD]|uniref:Type II secretory pathway, component ExeA (Predicted ATPase) n=1 Tax=Beggiatoa alba B18LD TaxID=395493 RepID=I3CCP1_9GAMM|nr:AAA family ATPase [Beggiatoa alba]EIJ41384.1 type II secretory pathway, component ExeA (predicted ATPase) [Beggiatoa alba B18LD]